MDNGLTSEEIHTRGMEVASHIISDWHAENGKYLSGICPGCGKNIPLFYFNGTHHGREDFDIYTCPACHGTYVEEKIRKVTFSEETSKPERVAVAGQ